MARTIEPRMIAYWLGYIQEADQGYPQLRSLPETLDVVALAFALVQDGLVQSTCAGIDCPGGPPPSNPTCLLDTAADPTHTRENIATWIRAAKAEHDVELVLSIGGASFCDWDSVNRLPGDRAAKLATFVQSVVDELARWNALSEDPVIDGVDIDYENPDTCGSTLEDPDSVSISEIIRSVAEALPDAIVSVPIYGGSPDSLLGQLAALTDDGSLSYAATMGYGCGMDFYEQYASEVRSLAMGFNVDDGPGAITSCLSGNPSIGSAMLWNLSSHDAPECLAAMNSALPS